MTHPLAEALCHAGRQLHEQGLIAGLAGNLSVRLDEDRLLITPRGTNKSRLRPQDMVTLPLALPPEGHDQGEATQGSTEFPFHRACYLASDEVGAVVHTHAPALTAVGVRGLDITATLPELELAVGSVVLLDFAPSGSEQLGKATGDAVAEGAGVILLKNHGAVSVGGDLDDAVNRMELAELAAYTVLLSQDRVGDLDLARLIKLRAHLDDSERYS
ncbi:MAG: class II aldolase/adducin family protein [Longimicrobiales bacterium]